MARRRKRSELYDLIPLPPALVNAALAELVNTGPRPTARTGLAEDRTGTPAARRRFWRAEVRRLVPRRFVGYAGARGVATAVERCLGELARLLPEDPATVADALATMLAREQKFLECCDDSNGWVGDALKAAVVLWGEATALLGKDPSELAEWVLAEGRENGYGIRDRIVAAFAEALGGEGLRHLCERLRFEIARLRPGRRGGGGKEESAARLESYGLVGMLEQVADALGDVGLYLEAVSVGGRPETYAEEVARRQLAAGEPEAALATLDRGEVRPRREREVLEVRLGALAALGRAAEAQNLLWASFRGSLANADLERFLDRLGSAAERAARAGEALAIAAQHPRAAIALAFLLERGAHSEAAALVRRRIDELDGTDYVRLRPAAAALLQTAPDAATLLYRQLVLAVLERGSSANYTYALRDFHAAAEAWGRAAGRAPGIATHEEFVAGLQSRHGRKSAFWGRLKS